MPKLPETNLVISAKTLFTLTLFILGVYLAWLLQGVIVALFISLLLATAINPFVVRLERRGVSRQLGITLIFLLLILSLLLIFAAVVPPFVRELYRLLDTIVIPQSLKNSLLSLEYSLQDLEVIFNQLKGLPRIFDAVSGIFSVIVVAVTFGVVTYYILMERPTLHRYLVWLFGNSRDEKKAERFVDALEHQIGGWVRGEALLMFVVGGLTYLGLAILGVPYALPLAILAGVLEILPNVGPTLASIPALIIALTHGSPLYAAIVGGAYILIQQLENSFIVPKIMKQSVGINPLITILCMIVGLKLGGVVGAFIAVPLYLCIKVVATEWYRLRLPESENP